MNVSIRTQFPEFEGTGMSEQQMLAYDRYRFWRICITAAVWYSFYYLGRLNWGFCIPWIIDDLHITKLEAGMGATAILWDTRSASSCPDASPTATVPASWTRSAASGRRS